MQIRQATVDDAEAIAHVHIETWRTTYTGIVPQDHLDRLDRAKRAKGIRKYLSDINASQLYLVAETDEGKVIGFAASGPARTDDPGRMAEIFAIYILKDYQGKGYGKALTAASVKWMIAQGYDSMIIWVLADNPSRAFYERMGGEYSGAKEIEIGGANLKKVSYVWHDLTQLTD